MILASTYVLCQLYVTFQTKIKVNKKNITVERKVDCLYLIIRLREVISYLGHN